MPGAVGPGYVAVGALHLLPGQAQALQGGGAKVKLVLGGEEQGVEVGGGVGLVGEPRLLEV